MKMEAQKLSKKWRGQWYSSTYSFYARGVSVWVAPGVPFQLRWQTAEVEGRYILLHDISGRHELMPVEYLCS